MKILIVEDEQPLATGLRFNFEQEGYETCVAEDGPTALARFRQADPPFDLVILDLMLPGMSGYETCQAIRELNEHVPILVLSARTLAQDKAQAFDCGCDQYITKPFALPELLSRVRNLLERRPASPGVPPSPSKRSAGRYRFDDVEIDFDRFEVHVGGQTHRPTSLEMQLLRYFVENEGTVLPRHQILENVWPQDADVTTRTIDNFVLRLRRLIEKNPARPCHILSVRGTGYRFVADPAAESKDASEQSSDANS